MRNEAARSFELIGRQYFEENKQTYQNDIGDDVLPSMYPAVNSESTRRPTFCPIHFGPNGFRPTLDLSNLLSSKTYIRPFCFRPILVHFLFMSIKKQKLDFVQYLGFIPIKAMQTPPPVLIQSFSSNPVFVQSYFRLFGFRQWPIFAQTVFVQTVRLG